jgi:F0F1-type ATP synthase gamma subunit
MDIFKVSKYQRKLKNIIDVIHVVESILEINVILKIDATQEIDQHWEIEFEPRHEDVTAPLDVGNAFD